MVVAPMLRYSMLLLAVAASGLPQSPMRYDNYQVHRTIPTTRQQLETLKELEEKHEYYDFWKDVGGVGMPVDIMVPPSKKYDFRNAMKLANLTSEVFIDNVQKLIDEETPTTRKSTKPDQFDWTNYHTLDEIYKWFECLASRFAVVSIIEGGRSYKGRYILGIKISLKPGNKAIYIDGGIHAREWISTAVVTYIINQLMYSEEPAIYKLVEDYDWYIFPTVNPDGYHYSHSSCRMWRKNRQPHPPCTGADLNRNWGYRWMHGGASNNSCSSAYGGSSAFSEVETRTLSEFIKTIGSELEIVFSFHSYSQLLLIPFGHDEKEVPANNEEMLAVGKNATLALAKRYGTVYQVGNIPEVVYVASGGSVDWILANYRHIRFAYTYELRDTGKHGFLLPSSLIIPTAEETLDSVISIVLNAIELKAKNNTNTDNL